MYIREHWKEQTSEQMAMVLHRGTAAVDRQKSLMGCVLWKQKGRRQWSEEDKETLRDLWGEKTAPAIAQILGRSVQSVRNMYQKLKLPGQKEAGSIMSARAVALLMGVCHRTVIAHWIPKGLRARRKALGESSQKTTIILFDDLLQWLRTHQDLWDSRRVELYALGVEYPWLQEKRQRDQEHPPEGIHRKAWTGQEDDRIRYLRKKEWTAREIAEDLGRSEGAVYQRMCRMRKEGRM